MSKEKSKDEILKNMLKVYVRKIKEIKEKSDSEIYKLTGEIQNITGKPTYVLFDVNADEPTIYFGDYVFVFSDLNIYTFT